VVLVGGVGVFYLTQHDKPYFCNFICHTPMDPYVASYEDGVSIDAYDYFVRDDKGKATAVAASKDEDSAPGELSVSVHANVEAQEINCLTCHEPSLGEQMTEGMHWVTGNYEVPLQGIWLYAPEKDKESGSWTVAPTVTVDADGKTTSTGPKIDSVATSSDWRDGAQFCLRSGCHTDDEGNPIEYVSEEGANPLTQLIAATANNTRNPHNSHLTNNQNDCSTCHQTHEKSYNLCLDCHDDAPSPDGWLTKNEKSLATKAAKEAAAQ